MIKVSDYLVGFLKRQTGIEHVFMLSGGMAMHLVESFGSRPDIKVVPMHHEQAAGIAASAYGRARNMPAVCLVTAGPGATNAVTPCAGAFMESLPLVIVSGQVSRRNARGVLGVRQKGIQEVDIVSVVRSVTKYAVHVTEPSSIRYHLEKALHYATSGRPGPVWIDIPVDVQGALIDEQMLAQFVPSYSENDMKGQPVNPRIPQAVNAKLRAAQRPMLVLGQGVRLGQGESLVEDLIHALGVPVQTTWNGMDLVAHDHPLHFGRANLFGPRYANLLIQSADVLLCIGTRLGIQHTGYNVEGFARNADIVMVDLDSTEMEKPGLNVVMKIRSDARAFMTGLLEEVRSRPLPSSGAWIEHCCRIKKKYPTHRPLEEIAAEPFVDPFYFVRKMTDVLPDDAVIPYGSSGMAHTVFGGNYLVKKGQRAFSFKGLAAMGYGIPCCVGAAFALPGRQIFTFVGEGGLQINIQDLQTIRHFGLPVKVVVFNNGGYHSIHMTQKNFFDGHYVASGPESDVTFPPLDGVASLYGFQYFKIASNTEVADVMRDVVSARRPCIVEVMIDPQKALEPKVVSYQKPDGSLESRPLEDMFPLLPREELQADLPVPLVS